MPAKSKWLDKYELVDVEKIPDVVAPLGATWAKAILEMPPSMAGRLPLDGYDAAISIRQTILGSVRAARQSGWGLKMKVHTKVVPEGEKYVLYFWKEG